MYPLRAWLPDMDPSTDRANRGKPLGRKLIGEHLNSLLLYRIFLRIADPARPVSRYLSAANEHHQQLIRPDQSHCRPCGHAAPIRPWPMPCATFAASVVAMPRPSNHLASAGIAALRRAESSSTIELA